MGREGGAGFLLGRVVGGEFDDYATWDEGSTRYPGEPEELESGGSRGKSPKAKLVRFTRPDISEGGQLSVRSMHDILL